MTDRQEATRKALQWAYRADRAACDYRATRSDDPLSERHAAVGQQARETTLMWATIARLLPAVIPDTELDPSLCPSRHQIADGIEPCTLDAHHMGYHRGVTSRWTDPQAITEPDPGICDDERANLGSLLRPARCILPTGHPMPHTDLTGSRWQPIPQQCRSRHETPDGLLRCDRKAGHHGVHSHPSCQWPNQANAATPTSPSVPGQRKPVEDSELPETGPHTGSCCQQAVAHVAEQLLKHARTAPGLGLPERRALEDAVEFMRAHKPAVSAPEQETRCLALTPHGPHWFVAWPGQQEQRCPGVPGSQS